MSQGLYLVCHETRQEVHVSESSAVWFRGADSSTVVGAFCDAHAFRHRLVVLGENWDYPVARPEYTAWTPDNVAQRLHAMAGNATTATTANVLEAIRQGNQNDFVQGYFSAVAYLLETLGPVPFVREMFLRGGSPEHANAWSKSVFRQHRLMDG